MSTPGVAQSIPLATAGKKKRRSGERAPYFFISPFYILFAIFFLFPTLFALVLGFFKWSAMGTPEFFGLRNYERLFSDPIFWQSVNNTIFYSAGSLFVVMPLALLQAMALNSKRLKLRVLWRAIYFAPIVTSTVAISLVFRMLYNNEYGLINNVLTSVGVTPVDWLGNAEAVKVAVMGVVLWRWTGLLAVYFLAGLQSISEELYEAAEIDGANSVQKFRFVTIPMLSPTIFFNVVLAIIAALQVFDAGYVLTRGGPNDATLFYMINLYERAFQLVQLGYASALAWILFIIIMAITLLVIRSSALWVFYETEQK